MLIPIEGTWCLILGASSGMGRAVARAMAAQGANVIGVHFDTAAHEEATAQLVDELRGHGVEAHFFNVNAASPAVRAELVPRIAELSGGTGLHVLVHSLAFGTLVPYLPRAGWERGITHRQLDMTLNVMAHSLVYWVQDLVAADLLPRGSKVYAMTSAGVTQALPSYGAVSAAKCALEAHVRQLACELAPREVAVNALRAGVTPTPSLARIPEHTEFVDRATLNNPHGRLTRPEDVAEAIVLLSRTDSSWITGNTIGVDGAELYAAGGAWNPHRADAAG
ncbi:SDR family oxidoreductase [Actinoallomurus spadix]|uniref:SDR family oxidoreductase n=1 Tax=Actinoallomurus spadix TaxID=79912 RepID=A0ABP3HLN5_9ACTN|nr:SDR family oxidoreductase [Actinoallomurus spadix]MCO5991425.1 SDR family oxidoreductase [Actinoallomurus spadix]